MQVNYPTVKVNKDNKVYINLYIENQRYRIFNGKRIGLDLNPNKFPFEKRIEMGHLLAAKIYEHLIKGGEFKGFRTDKGFKRKNDKDYLDHALEIKLSGDGSIRYKKYLSSIHKSITKDLDVPSLTTFHLETFLNKYISATSYNTVRRHLNVLINEAVKQGMSHNPMEGIKARKAKAVLHKPFGDVPSILEEIKGFNHKLYLCCLITYGCLLRPHREVRELSWGDFSEDLSSINLSGHRNKSGKNRIVPVPKYVRDVLANGDSGHNIFSGKVTPLNSDYFKTLWSRFKKTSTLLEDGQTLYSFRHSGAIDIFKRTGSITKLQKAMGHSSINVSLTYLRGLEIGELKEEDMPSL